MYIMTLKQSRVIMRYWVHNMGSPGIMTSRPQLKGGTGDDLVVGSLLAGTVSECCSAGGGGVAARSSSFISSLSVVTLNELSTLLTEQTRTNISANVCN